MKTSKSKSDLYSFLEAYQDEHIRIKKPVKLEHIGALVGQAGDTIVFENIEGYPDYWIVDGLFMNRRAQGRVLRCKPDEVVKRMAEVLREGPKELKEAAEAPCQELVFTGNDIDLWSLPIVRHTDLDPYPYATSFVVHRDPETGNYNQMYPRSGVLGPKEMVTSYVTRTANQILAKHKAAGTLMPQALVIGSHPAWELAGCYSYTHDDWWEMQLFENITGEVGEVVRCKTVDLIVPADASIVIEGYVNPGRTAQDGPNPGPTMLFTPYSDQQPVFEITAITMRKKPIYRHHQCTPFTDHQEMPRLFHEAIIYERLRAMGLKVQDVHFPQGGGSLSVIIQVEPSLDGEAMDALLTTLGSPWMNMKMAIAVNTDINIYDYRDVHYAMATRVNPAKDIMIINNTRAFPFDPSGEPVIGAFPNTEQSRFPSVGSKIGINATKPVPYRAKERKNFERAWPIAWNEVNLKDYLE